MPDLELLLNALRETTNGLGCSGVEPWESIGVALEKLTANLEHEMSAAHADLAAAETAAASDPWEPY